MAHFLLSRNGTAILYERSRLEDRSHFRGIHFELYDLHYGSKDPVMTEKDSQKTSYHAANVFFINHLGQFTCGNRIPAALYVRICPPANKYHKTIQFDNTTDGDSDKVVFGSALPAPGEQIGPSWTPYMPP